MEGRSRGPVLTRAVGFPVESAYFQDLHTECLKPGEEAVEGCLVGKRAVQDGFDGLYGSIEPVKVKQGLWRKSPRDADLVIMRRHRGPPAGRKPWPSTAPPGPVMPPSARVIRHPSDLRGG